jgi:hypothetical protein
VDGDWRKETKLGRGGNAIATFIASMVVMVTNIIG